MLEAIKEGTVVEFHYRNWKGKYGKRRVLVKGIFFGDTAYHPMAQFFLSGFDFDKSQNRDFAITNIYDVTVIGQEDS